jgi:hypothetical protein
MNRRLKYLNQKNNYESTMDLIEEIYTLEEAIADFGDGTQEDIAIKIEGLYKKKLKKIIDGPDAAEALQLGEAIGYGTLDDYVSDGIQKENDQGNSK